MYVYMPHSAEKIYILYIKVGKYLTRRTSFSSFSLAGYLILSPPAEATDATMRPQRENYGRDILECRYQRNHYPAEFSNWINYDTIAVTT